MKLTKKLLAIMLSLIMVFTMIAVPVSAAGTIAEDTAVEEVVGEETTDEEAAEEESVGEFHEIFEAIKNLMEAIHNLVGGIMGNLGKECPFCGEVHGKDEGEDEVEEAIPEEDPDYTYYDIKYSLVITDYIENKNKFKSTRIKAGSQLEQPEDPVAPIGYFDGWYTSARCDTEFDFSQPINADTIIYAKWGIDETDSDKDGLYDDLELYVKTDPTKYDTDKDGLNDYYELLSNTDPLVKDTDKDSISDYDEDFDEDTLTNGEEMGIGTQPNYKDSDGDGLTDAEESQNYKTNPLLEDTDGDGAKDGWEVENKFDPLVYNESFVVEEISLSISETNPVTASVKIELPGDEADTVSVNPVNYSNNPFISESIPGYLGQAYNFETTSDFESAELIFTYDTSLGEIGEYFQPRIYYFNEIKNTFEELLNQTVTNGMVKAKVEHFSTYILLNKVEFDKVWNEEIKAPIIDGSGQSAQNIDVVFVIDTSGSMSGSRINTAKNAMYAFLDALTDNDRAGLVSFTSSATIKSQLNLDKSKVKTAVSGLYANGLTSMYTGLGKAIGMLTDDNDAYGYKMIIVLSDGYDEPASNYNTNYAPLVDSAIANNIVVYTIGTGASDTSLLKKVAEGTNGKYYEASQTSNIIDVFTEIQEDTVDLTIDSNEDKIPDYFNDLIEKGKLVLNNGSREFSGFDFNYDKNGDFSDDYDGDGLLNGEELVVYYDEDTKRVYMYMVSDPTTQHSDTDEADDFIEKKSGTNPLVFDHFREVDVNALTNDDLYYYEDFVEDVYDGSVAHQISAAFLCVITTSWNPVGECREFLTNYLDKYGETNVEVAEVSDNEEMKMWINNLDRLAGFVEKLVTANDHGVKLFTIKKNIKALIDLVRGYKITSEEIAKRYYAIIEMISVHTDDFDVIIIGEPVLIEETITAIKKSPIDDFDTKGLGLSIALDALNGVIDIYNTVHNFALVKANYSVLNQNIDIINNMSKHASRIMVSEAATDIINAMGEGFGEEMAKAVGADLSKMTVNMAISIASCNPYVAAVKFVVDMINLFTGLSGTLEREDEMLFYETMSDSVEDLIHSKARFTADYTVFDNSGNLERYLIHLAQIRILGEDVYRDYYTHGSPSWFTDKSAVKQKIKVNIDLVNIRADYLNIKLSPNLPKA